MTEIVRERLPPTTELESRPYLVLLLTREGHVVRRQCLAARNDDQALRLAKSMVDGHAVDLWDGLRFIEHFDAEESNPAGQP